MVVKKKRRERSKWQHITSENEMTWRKDNKKETGRKSIQVKEKLYQLWSFAWFVPTNQAKATQQKRSQMVTSVRHSNVCFSSFLLSFLFACNHLLKGVRTSMLDNHLFDGQFVEI